MQLIKDSCHGISLLVNVNRATCFGTFARAQPSKLDACGTMHNTLIRLDSSVTCISQSDHAS